MIMRLKFLCLFALVLPFWAFSPSSNAQESGLESAPPAGDECKVSMRAPSELTWRGPTSRGYDPDHSTVHAEPLSVEIRGGGTDCSYLVEIAPIDESYALINGTERLLFRLQSEAGALASSPSSAITIEGDMRAYTGSQFANIFLSIEPYQRVPAGRYAQDFDLTLYSRTGGVVTVAETRRVGISAEVVPRVSASIGQNATSRLLSTKIDLGSLKTGKETPLGFSVSANTAYEVRVRSQNAGRLKHFKSDAAVGYELWLDGVVIDRSILQGDGIVSTGNTTRSHDLRLRIVGDEASVPAGYYSDQLTVTITAG